MKTVAVDYTAHARKVGDKAALTRARIIFVPGLKPKPPPEVYSAQLERVLLAGLERVDTAAARRLREQPGWFVLVAWTYAFYEEHREIDLDLPGIERLIAGAEPTPAERRIVGSWSRSILRLLHRIGDTVPLLGRTFVSSAMRAQMHDANRYLRNRDGVGEATRAPLTAELEAAWADGARVMLIGHSLGSVIAYDALWELSHERGSRGRVDLFVTMGSPLATHFIRRRLRGAGRTGREAYPTNIRRWVNFSARGDMTALHPRLEPFFGEMRELGLLESIEDHVNVDNFFRSNLGLNAHDAYGYLAEQRFAALLADWLDED